LRDLWSTGYGHVLLVKLGLVSLALTWGAAHHFLAVPRIERPGVTGTLARTLVGESAVAMAVLLAAAILTDSKPPPQPPAKASLATPTIRAGAGLAGPSAQVPLAVSARR
jgi:putative copper export protein